LICDAVVAAAAVAAAAAAVVLPCVCGFWPERVRPLHWRRSCGLSLPLAVSAGCLLLLLVLLLLLLL